MPPNLAKTLLGIGVAWLCGCEAIAGIQDLQYTPSTEAGESNVALDAAGSEGGSDTGTDAVGDGSPAAEAGPFDATLSADATDGAALDANLAPESALTGEATDGSFETSDAGKSGPDAHTEAGSAVDATTDAGADATIDASLDASPDGGSVVELIDDMENTGVPVGWIDGVNVANPRSGNWFTFNDPTPGGVLVPAQGSLTAQTISVIPGGRGASVHAAHVAGNDGFTAYGAGMGFNLNAPISAGVYNATAYRGFVFWARALGDAGATSVRFNVLDQNTAPPSSGGACDGGACSGYFGFTLTLTPNWQQYTVLYSELARPTFALPDGLPFDPAHVIGCQFQVSPGVAFDLWIDDIDFVDN